MTTAPTCPVPGNSDSLHPFRGESFSAEHLELHFREVASRLELATEKQLPRRDFARRFEQNAIHIANTHAAVTDAAHRGEVVPAEAEWLLDNYYVVEEQLREIRDDLPRGYYQELPKTKAGHPRVYELARELAEYTATGPVASAGDLDADWQRAESSGEETVGGSVATPDQDVVDEIGHALGVEQPSQAPLRTSEEILEDRDRRYWELERRARRKEDRRREP